MRLLNNTCDVFALGVEFALNREVFGERWVAVRIGWRCIGVAW